jgi:uncharacterized protein DUF6968
VIAARRVFHTVGRRPRRVVLTIDVPRRMAGSDWACRVRIQGLGAFWARPHNVYGIDALQALQLTVQVAQAMLENCGQPLAWLGEAGDLGLTPNITAPRRVRSNAKRHRRVRKRP